MLKHKTIKALAFDTQQFRDAPDGFRNYIGLNEGRIKFWIGEFVVAEMLTHCRCDSFHRRNVRRLDELLSKLLAVSERHGARRRFFVCGQAFTRTRG